MLNDDALFEYIERLYYDLQNVCAAHDCGGPKHMMDAVTEAWVVINDSIRPRDVISEIKRLRRQHEVDQAQIKAYEKALGWYADPANWIEQVDSRGRETTRLRWADDDGRMAKHALAVWHESRKPV
jgi:radical SAM superfamily enzyme YgiQ (UPF0313 family)